MNQTLTCPRCKGVGKIPSGSDLRKLRLKLGWSQKRMAIELDVFPSFLCDIEKGRREAPTYLIQTAAFLARQKGGSNG